MKGRAITREISVQEMQEMRERGMTNQQIADSLEINYQTVLRYLGKQPAGMRSEYGGSYRPQDARTDVVAKQPERESTLHVLSSTTVCDGTHGKYTFYNGMGVVAVEFKAESGKLQLDKNGLEAYIMELMDALAMLN